MDQPLVVTHANTATRAEGWEYSSDGSSVTAVSRAHQTFVQLIVNYVLLPAPTPTALTFDIELTKPNEDTDDRLSVDVLSGGRLFRHVRQDSTDGPISVRLDLTVGGADIESPDNIFFRFLANRPNQGGVRFRVANLVIERECD